MNKLATILVVEDQRAEREALARALELENYAVVTARNTREAVDCVQRSINLVICDLRLGKSSGVEVLRTWRQQRPDAPFIIVTAYGDVPSAVAAIKLGAEDYLTKPVDPDQLLTIVDRALADRQTLSSSTASSVASQAGSKLDQLLGDSLAMREVSDRLLRAAASNSTVLILGESGTGKELVAQAVHTHSARSDQPLVSVNVAALPEGLVESELFGHVAGSFTGATADRIGKFEAANSGTLFIDEIGDTELGAQAKLLRVLETRVITPVGSNREQRVDVRVIAATSKDLARLVADGAFREDLYYRLNVVVLRLPPLRERHGDIAPLTNHFLNLTSHTLGRSAPRLSPELMERLELLEWPGNVRQLKNAIESMVVLSEGDELTLSDLPADLQSPPPATENPSDTEASGDLEGLERRAILDALERSLGNRTHAANSLGISVRTLQRKLKAWGLAGEI